MTDKPQVTIYTDGGSEPNPGPGGWAARLIAANGTIKEISGAELGTTNNRMELTAAIEALRVLRLPSSVTMVTDSQYLKQGITEWLPVWIKRGWRRRGARPVLNEDLWRALHAETQRHDISWQWVRGHAGNVHNERVDVLATAARRALTGERAASRMPNADVLPDVEIALRVSATVTGRRAGWAARVVDPASGEGQTHTGQAASATSSRVLLAAALEALRHTAPGAAVRVYCPDTYLCDGMTKWIDGWQQRGWRTKDKSEVKHRDLWEALLAAASRRRVQWVPEPAGLDLARELASLAAKAAGNG